jgi:GTP cyclohydrolase I
MRPTTYDEVDPQLTAFIAEVVMRIPGAHDGTQQHWTRTPERFARYLTHLGRKDDYGRWTTFANVDDVKHMIVVPGIDFWSACTHHLLPFVGKVDLAYIPNEKIFGLSKIPLLVREVARGFWMQEDLTRGIVQGFSALVKPAGIAVRIRAQHTCQLLDVGPPIPWMVTTELHGLLLHNPSAKVEFLEACR